jgi:exonuclease VII large subunit
METGEVIGEMIYSPSAVLNLFNNAISVSQVKKLIQLKGIFQLGKGHNYSGYYYDSLRDESSDAQLIIVVPALIRNGLEAGKTITVNGYITRKVVNNASRIDLQLTITEVVAQTHNKYSEDELLAIEILQSKASKGYRDVHSWIKERIINERPFKIAVIIGRTAIVDNDIKHQLRESIGFYTLDFHRVSLSSEIEIVMNLSALEKQGYDIIAISRGGGENLEIFNKPSLVRHFIKLQALFVTAIGHKDDVTLSQKVADKAFITPSEFGQFLNDTYNHTTEEIQHSKAKLVEAVTAQLKANYQKQIENLNSQLKAQEQLKTKSIEDIQKVSQEKVIALEQEVTLAKKNYQEHVQESQKLHEQRSRLLQQQVEAANKESKSKDVMIASYKQKVDNLKGKGSVNWIAVIIAVAIGVIIGMALVKG